MKCLVLGNPVCKIKQESLTEAFIFKYVPVTVMETWKFLQKTKFRTKRTLFFQVGSINLRCCSVSQNKSVLSKDTGLIGAWSTPWSTRLTLGRLWHHVQLRETRSWETLPVGLGLNQHQMSLRAPLQERQWSWHTELKKLKLFLMFSEESPRTEGICGGPTCLISSFQGD